MLLRRLFGGHQQALSRGHSKWSLDAAAFAAAWPGMTTPVSDGRIFGAVSQRTVSLFAAPSSVANLARFGGHQSNGRLFNCSGNLITRAANSCFHR
jgi:hypothetical protein